MELKACLNGSQLRTNVLMKVRESLTDAREGETSLTIPQGISRYPNNAAWMIFGWLSALLFIGSASWMFYK